MSPISRDEYDKIDRALNDVYDAESNGRVGSHAILLAVLQKLGYGVMSVAEAIRKALSLLGQGWKDKDE